VFIIFLTLIVGINIVLYLNNNSIAKYFSLYDKPDKVRKFHQESVPITGGIFIFINIFFYIIFQIFFFENTFFFNNLNILIIFFVFCSLFFLLGILDDKFLFNPNLKFFLIFIFIIIILFLDKSLIIKNVNLRFANYYLNIFSIPWTALCFLLFINAFNMFDGLNLQNSTYTIFLLFILLFESQFNNMIIFIFIGVILFSILNKNNKSFLGDGGTYLLSFIIGYLFIKLYNENQIRFADQIVLAMIIPGIDLMRLFVQRIFIYKRSPFSPDRLHLHHYFLDKFGQKKTLLYINLLIIMPYVVANYFENFFIFIFFQLFIYFAILLSLQKKKNKL